VSLRGRHGAGWRAAGWRAGGWRVAAVATATLVAVACSRGKTPPLAVRNAMADSADQVMYHAKSVLTDRGVMKAEVYADTGYFFDDNTRIEMRVLTMNFFTVTGARNAVLKSQQGTYNNRTGNMEARDSVVVVTEDKRTLTTPVLRYAQARDEITSDSPFVLIDSAHRQMTGVGFISDPNMNRMRCLRACAATAGVVNLQAVGSDTVHGAGSSSPVPPPGATPTPPPSAGPTGTSIAAPATVAPSARSATTPRGPRPASPAPVGSPPPSAGAAPPRPTRAP
jgi:LPS export ABC transporter protein LptC